MSDPIEQLLHWAESKGIELNGIAPKSIPGRGIGLVSTRRIEPNEVILRVPSPLLRTLDNTPKSITNALQGATVHAILAASLAMDMTDPPSGDFRTWQAVFPTHSDILTSMPICWDPSLQSLLPSTAQNLLSKQRAKFEKDWSLISSSPSSASSSTLPQSPTLPMSPTTPTNPLTSITKDAFLYAWLLVNTRTFYHTTPRTKKNKLPREDHMALQPVADLFNHSPQGCTVSFDAQGFTIATTSTSAVSGPDEEVFIRYGSHSNDFLLVEYGFILPPEANSFDEVCLDEYLCPLFTAQQRCTLEGRGFWAGYMLDAETSCYRTQVALRLLCLRDEEDWLDVLEGRRGEEEDQEQVDKELLKVLRRFASDIDKVKEELNNVSVGDVARNSLRDRWHQIADLVGKGIKRVSK